MSNNDNEEKRLSKELEKTSEENKKFISDIDAQIDEVDLRYAEMLIEEEKKFLKFAKKGLSEDKE